MKNKRGYILTWGGGGGVNLAHVLLVFRECIVGSHQSIKRIPLWYQAFEVSQPVTCFFTVEESCLLFMFQWNMLVGQFHLV